MEIYDYNDKLDLPSFAYTLLPSAWEGQMGHMGPYAPAKRRRGVKIVSAKVPFTWEVQTAKYVQEPPTYREGGVKVVSPKTDIGIIYVDGRVLRVVGRINHVRQSRRYLWTTWDYIVVMDVAAPLGVMD